MKITRAQQQAAEERRQARLALEEQAQREAEEDAQAAQATPGGPTAQAGESRAAVRSRRALEGLTLKQRSFVVHFIGAAQGNATQAAVLAGYSPGNRVWAAEIGARLLRNPKVVAHIDRKARLSRHMSVDETLAEVAKVARADVAISERGKVAALTLQARLHRLVEEGQAQVNVGVGVQVLSPQEVQGKVNHYARALRSLTAKPSDDEPSTSGPSPSSSST